MHKVIVVLDPASGTRNLGDEVISDSVVRIIDECSEKRARIVRFSVHQKLSRVQIEAAQAADLVIAGGSNLLNFRYIPFWDGRWNNSLLTFWGLKDILLMGVGWQRYSDRSTFLGRALYPRIISSTMMHSVRDEFTREMLHQKGVKNSVNTSCPTMWGLTELHQSRIPRERSSSAVFTLTDYSQDPEKDKALIGAIKKLYNTVYFWPQGLGDLDYFRSLECEGMTIVGPSLAAFDELLTSDQPLDYIGTRLHGGIRALQKGRRTIVVGVDNRATEIARDTGIVVVDRKNVAAYEDVMAQTFDTIITLPFTAIEAWKDQLRRRVL